VSGDFITGLQDDLVEAMDRYERRSPRGRLAAGRFPRPLRPANLARVAATAAIIIAIVAAARTLEPRPQPARPHVVAVLEIGGQPLDAVLGGGSLWVDGFDGAITRVDPGERRVVTRVHPPGSAQAIAAGAGSLWLQTQGRRCVDGQLVRIDPGTGRIVRQTPVRFPEDGDGNLAVAGGGVWMTGSTVRTGRAGDCHPRQTLDRRDSSGARTASIALGRIAALAAAEGNLWVLSRTGTLSELDPVSGRVLHRESGLGLFSGGGAASPNALAADGAGVWVLSPTRATILHVRDGRIVKHLPVDASAQPVLAKARDGLWITTRDEVGAHNRLIRIDPATGAPTGALDLGAQQPVALIPAGDQLCVLTANGKLLFVES
jgi:streptogramin lyase